jgi:hypothetical protein
MRPQLRYYFTIAKLALIVIVPLLLLILPATFFDTGESICISKLLLNVECPACGLTRGCMHLIHLDWEEAYAYNMMSFIALPLVGIVWIQWGLKEYKILKIINKKLAELASLKPEA